MKERPILFNAPMVRALLDGSKTQARLILDPQPSPDFLKRGVIGGAPVPQWPSQNGVRWFLRDGLSKLIESPCGQPGDRLVVEQDILIEIVSVRVERLQDISDDDAWAEGIDVGQALLMGCTEDAARAAYSVLWESINGPDSWAANPWVWAVKFKRVAT